MAKLSTKQWQNLAKQYRAGQMTIAAIAKEFEISPQAIHTRAREKGWTRDLTRKTKEAVQAGAIAAAVPQAEVMTNQEIVQEFALIGVQVIVQHRRDIHALRLRRNSLMIRYDQITAQDARGQYKLNSMEDISVAAQILESVARIEHRIQTMERIAFNLDDDDSTVPEQIEIIGGLPPESDGEELKRIEAPKPGQTDIDM